MKHNLIIEYDNIRIVIGEAAKKEAIPEINLIIAEIKNKGLPYVAVFENNRLIE